ncbi:hypothetical protein BD560DRAFT_241111 [Blakeslea trispora]|nr:hypothetical protein BD560DRAFT_241111 [Blakeslea trispora]
MDQTYDATFCLWLKSEENVLVTSIYLHRIANEYPLERIVNALTWLTMDWRWENISVLVRHVTVDWTDDKGDEKRAILLRQLTNDWATHFTATLITTILTSTPYSIQGTEKRERFIKEFTKDWGFSKLSEFFMFLRSKANVDCKFKCAMLQEAAKRDATANQIAPKDRSDCSQPHHRRTSSNDFKEVKLSMLEEISNKQDAKDNSANNRDSEEQKVTDIGSSTEENRLQLFGTRCYTNNSGPTSNSPSASYPHRQTSHIESNSISSTDPTSSISDSETNTGDKKRLTSGSKPI